MLKDAARAAIASILYLVMILLAAEASFYAGIIGVLLTGSAVLAGPFAAARIACWVVPTDRPLVLRVGLGALAGLPVFLAAGYVLSRFDLRVKESSEAGITVGLWVLCFFAGALVLTRWRRPPSAAPHLEQGPSGQIQEASSRLTAGWRLGASQTNVHRKVLAGFAIANGVACTPVMIRSFLNIEGKPSELMLATALMCVVIPVWIVAGVLLWKGRDSGAQRLQQICALSFGYCAVLFGTKLAHWDSYSRAVGKGELMVDPYTALTQYQSSMDLMAALAVLYLAVFLYSLWAKRFGPARR